MKQLFFFLITLFLITSCNNPSTSENEENTTIEDSTLTSNSAVEQSKDFCFLDKFEGEPIKANGEVVQEMVDIRELNFTIEDGKVTGEYNYKPAEKDQMVGTFIGDMDENGEIRAIYDFMQEGEVAKVGLVIKVTDDEARVMMTQLDDKNQDLVITDTAIDDTFKLMKMDCNAL